MPPTAPVDPISPQEIEARYIDIRRLMDKILTQATIRGFSPEEPLPEDHCSPDTEQLINLCNAFAHSHGFHALVEKTIAQTLGTISDDTPLRTALNAWQEKDHRAHRKTLSRLSEIFCGHAQDTLGMELPRPVLRFKREARRLFPSGQSTLDYGGYTPFANPLNGGLIAINEHPDALEKGALHTAYITVHELIHWLENIIGGALQNSSVQRNPVLDNFSHDARMWKARTDLRAVIPPCLKKPYLAQHHERLPYAIEEPFKQGLQATL